MRYRKLGTTDLSVSVICLGTMTFGEQNSQQDGFDQMDYALERGVNFFDTAELYAVMPRKETYGKTEEIVGNWFKEKKWHHLVLLNNNSITAGICLVPLSSNRVFINCYHLWNQSSPLGGQKPVWKLPTFFCSRYRCVSFFVFVLNN